MDIADFLTARYDEEQRLAEATTPVPIAGRWCATRDKHAAVDTPLRLVQGRDPYEGEDWNDYESGEYSGTPVIAFSAEWQDEAEANLWHIAYHDPAQVLADITAKRAIIQDYQIVTASNAAEPDDVQHAVYDLVVKSLRMVLRRLAAPYADHADYDPNWSTTP